MQLDGLHGLGDLGRPGRRSGRPARGPWPRRRPYRHQRQRRPPYVDAQHPVELGRCPNALYDAVPLRRAGSTAVIVPSPKRGYSISNCTVPHRLWPVTTGPLESLRDFIGWRLVGDLLDPVRLVCTCDFTLATSPGSRLPYGCRKPSTVFHDPSRSRTEYPIDSAAIFRARSMGLRLLAWKIA